jgi:hypothetical protein
MLLHFPIVIGQHTYNRVMDYRPWDRRCGFWLLSDFSATTFMLLSVDCQGQVREVTPASDVAEIATGPYTGDLLIYQRQSVTPREPWLPMVQYVYVVISKTGKIVRELGDNLDAVQNPLGFAPKLWSEAQ